VFRVYIDEAGDRGRHAASSDHFVVSAVIVKDNLDAMARAELNALRSALGRHPGHVLHFRNLSHSQKIKACQDIAASSIECITNVVFCKRKLAATALPGQREAIIHQADPMYLYAVRLLLERVSWYVDENGGGSAIITFAHLRRFPTAKLHEYRSALGASDTQIRWNALANHPFRVSHPNKIDLLQIADTAASALFKAVEKDDYGNVEERYLRVLAPKLYCRGAAHITSYGLKVFPTSEARDGGSLNWLRSLR
jgi:Protein of unknown function (DUF3800)